MKFKKVKRTPDGPIDLYEAVTRRQLDPVFDDMENIEDIEDVEEFPDLEIDTEFSEDDYDDDSIFTLGEDINLLSVLRDELKLPESNRGYLKFMFNDEIYEGKPMAEINSDKFVFLCDNGNKMKSFKLSQIEPL